MPTSRPAAAAAAAAVSTDVAQPRGDRQPVVVVVGDPGVSELLTTTLKLAGYEVGTADTGAEGVARVARHRFGLVVIDAALPDLVGFRRGRRVAPADRPPVLFLTVGDSLHTLLPELGLGAEDYVTPAEYRLLRRCWPTRNACSRRNRSAGMSGASSVPTTRSRNSSPDSDARWTGKNPR